MNVSVCGLPGAHGGALGRGAGEVGEGVTDEHAVGAEALAPDVDRLGQRGDRLVGPPGLEQGGAEVAERGAQLLAARVVDAPPTRDDLLQGRERAVEVALGEQDDAVGVERSGISLVARREQEEVANPGRTLGPLY